MMTAPEFADAVGRKNLATALEVGATAVSNAVTRGWFPSSWFLVAKHLAQVAGIECPPELFKMYSVGSNDTHIVDDGAALQEAGRKNARKNSKRSGL